MKHATRPTRAQCLDRETATLAVLMLALCATACRAESAARSGDAQLNPEVTVIEPLYQAAKVYNQRHGRRTYESPKPVLRKIIFVVDTSGSMMRVLPLVINESQRAIDTMGPYHSLTVITFSGRGICEVDSTVGWSGLRQCTPSFKSEVREWLSLFNHRYKTGGAGMRFAEAAIVRALRYKPELIFILSDHLGGSGPGSARLEIHQDSLLASIRTHNDVQNPTKINTISFVNADPLAELGISGTLQRIADETGGTYKYISKWDLNFR